MKNIFLFIAAFAYINYSKAQSIFFSENIGLPSGNTIISWYAGWENPLPITFLSTSIPETEVRNTAASAGYPGASGGGNVFFTNTPGRNFIISGINSLGYSSISLSLGHYKNTTAGNNELTIEVSTDGSTFLPLTYSRATGTGTTGWILINPTGFIPGAANLWIRFTQTSSISQFRIDDIVLTGIPSALPVKFHQVSAKSHPGGLKITWANLTESDLVSYAVERSANGIDFVRSAIIFPARNDGGRADYEWLDQNPLPGVSFYRIQSLENDGKRLNSSIVRVDLHAISNITLYPNPLHGTELTLQAELRRGAYPIRVLNAGGQQVFTLWLIHNGGLITEVLELPVLKSGVYYLEVGETVKKLIVNR